MGPCPAHWSSVWLKLKRFGGFHRGIACFGKTGGWQLPREWKRRVVPLPIDGPVETEGCPRCLPLISFGTRPTCLFWTNWKLTVAPRLQKAKGCPAHCWSGDRLKLKVARGACPALPRDSPAHTCSARGPTPRNNPNYSIYANRAGCKLILDISLSIFQQIQFLQVLESKKWSKTNKMKILRFFLLYKF